ncbi:unnamed protein product [Pleuronectes platessa]|uniref:Uncharacterized protein n=1 Tax=Pleuronectes platessa TaxID=8262 RepID=A0A9N7VCE4_PLEPL|nr:unnamed protein product [Pleuronectes platessa]
MNKNLTRMLEENNGRCLEQTLLKRQLDAENKAQMEKVAEKAARDLEITLLKRQLDAGSTALKETRVALAGEIIALKKELFAKSKLLIEQLEEKAALGAEIATLRKQAVYNVALVEENSVLKKELFAKNKLLMEQLEEKPALGAEIASLGKQNVYNVALVEENSILEKKLDAENTGIKEHVAEKAILENLAAENAALAADRNALKKEIVKSVDTARAREEELEKKVEDLMTTIKVKEEENFCLSANLQLQDLDEVLVEHEWQAKFEDLQETYEEKLRCSVLEQVEKERKMDEALELLILQNIKLQRLVLTTKEYREKVKKETEEKKKQEKKEQQEREKKEKEERMKLKKREKKEKEEEREEAKVGKIFSFFCFKRKNDGSS